VALVFVIASSSWACAAPRLSPIRGERRDEQLIFEQRIASTVPSESGVDWQSWQLYQSGRLVYQRAKARARVTRVAAPRLQAARGWLGAHDAELLKSTTHGPPPSTPNVSAMCQLRLSVGLILAPLGDPRYDACETLKALILPAE